MIQTVEYLIPGNNKIYFDPRPSKCNGRRLEGNSKRMHCCFTFIMYQFLWAICYFNVSQPIQCKVTKLRDLLSGGLKQNYLHAEQPPEIHVGHVYFQDNWETISKNDQFEAIPFKTGIAHGHVFPVSFQVYSLYILQPPGYKINHTYYFALFHLFLVHVWVCFSYWRW